MAEGKKGYPWIDTDGIAIREVTTIDSASLVRIIRDKKIFRGKPFSYVDDINLDTLVRVIVGIQMEFSLGDVTSETAKRYRKIVDVIKNARLKIPNIRREYARKDERLEMLFWGALKEQDLKLLDRLERDLSTLESTRFFRRFLVTDERRDRWHGFAFMLANQFTHEVESAYPQARELGRSTDGPVVRFVTNIIPAITGENPGQGAVAQYLKRKRREAKTGTS